MSNWRDSLPEDVAGHKELDNIKAENTEEALAAALDRVAGMRQTLGSALKVPGKDDPPEALVAFEERIGGLGYQKADEIPEDAAGYSAEVDPTGIPEEVLDPFIEQRRQYYAAAKVGKKTAEKLLLSDAETLRGAIAGYHKDVELATGAVQQTYGDKAPAAIKAAERGAAAAGIEDLMNQPLMTLDGKVVSLGNRPEMIDMLSKIGQNLGEDKNTQVRDNGTVAPDNTDDVRTERTLKMKEYASMMRKNPGDPELAIIRKQLHKMSMRIAAAETGDMDLLKATPEHIAKYTGR